VVGAKANLVLVFLWDVELRDRHCSLCRLRTKGIASNKSSGLKLAVTVHADTLTLTSSHHKAVASKELSSRLQAFIRSDLPMSSVPHK
jgi:hypothetical protein